MRNYKGAGSLVTVTLLAAVASGEGVVKGSLFGIATVAGGVGERVALQRDQEVTMPKKAGVVIAEGDKIFFDNAGGQKNVTNVSAVGLFKIGIASSAAAGGDASVDVVLNGVDVTAA